MSERIATTNPYDCAFCVAPTTRRLPNGAAADCPLHGGDLPEPTDAEALRDQVRQLTYERSLLGAARSILDQVGDDSTPITPALRMFAANCAQRIVDEIGHPVTDEPALGPDMRDQLARVKALTSWMRATGCGLGADQIDALLTDPRDTIDLITASGRTGHRIGCDCPTCTATNQPPTGGQP